MRVNKAPIGIFLAIGFIALTLLTSVAEARAIRGVDCNGGFFVNAPDKRIFWVEDTQSRKSEVHDGTDSLVVLAECGSGVVSVFKDSQNPDLVKAFYSKDCNNISKAIGATQQIAEHKGDLVGLNVTSGEVTFSFKSGEKISSSACGTPSAN